MAITRTPQDYDAALALAEALAVVDGIGEPFRRSDQFEIDSIRLKYTEQAHDLLSVAETLGWTLKRV